MEAAPEALPTELDVALVQESRFDEEALQAAREIESNRHGDTLGAFTRLRKNVGRNALLVSNSVSVATTLTANGFNIVAVPTGLVYEAAAGVVVAGGAYFGARYTEKRRVRRTGAKEQSIREEVGEPVDILKTGRRNKETVLRWYGYDEAFVAESQSKDSEETSIPSPATVIKGFETAVAFAKEAGIKEVAVSARLLDGVSEDKRDSFGKVVENDTLTRRKRVQAKDLSADKQVLRCNIQTAETLIAEIKGEADADALLVVVDLLKGARPGHPFINYALDLVKNGRSDVAVREAKKVLRSTLEQKAGNGTSLVKHTNREGETTLSREYTFARLTGVDMDLVGITQSRSGTGREAYYKGRESLLKSLGFETVDALIQDTHDHRHTLAPNVVQERAEAAAWLLLHDPAAVTAQYLQSVQGESKGPRETQTFLQRVANEPPRSTLTVLRRKGKVPKGEEQTVEYRQARPGRIRRAVGTLVMVAATSGAAGGAGHGVHKGMNSLYISLMEDYAHAKGYKGYLPLDQWDDFEQHLEDAPGLSAAGSRMYNDVSTFDHDISDAMAPSVLPWIPKGFAESLLPYADPDWLYQKQGALKDLNNAYSDSNKSLGVGDVNLNQNGAAWKLTAPEGINTKGYWAQNMASSVGSDTPYGVFTPPYREFGIAYGPDEGRSMQAAYNPNYLRYVKLKDPDQIAANDPYIQVEGQKIFDSSSMGYVDTPSDLGPGYADQAFTFDIPVLLGSDVVAAKMERFVLKDNRPLGSQDFNVVQTPNGIFYMAIDSDKMPDSNEAESYVKITYWIDPHADTERPVHADVPLTMQGEDFKSIPFTEGMSDEEALRVWRALSGDPKATELPTAEEAAEFVEGTKGYSRTPYQDNHIPLSEDEPSSDSEGFATIGVVAAENPDADCNGTATISVLASRGVTEDGGFVNPTTGYKEDGDGILKTGEAHMWLTSDKIPGKGAKGNIIDGTPQDNSPEPPGEAQGFDPNMNPTEDMLRTIRRSAEGILALSLFAFGARAGARRVPRMVEGTRERLANSAGAKLHPGPIIEPKLTAEGIPEELTPEQKAHNARIEAEERRLHDLVSILQWMQHAPEGAQLDDKALPRYFSGSYANNLANRYNALPPDMDAKRVRTLMRILEKDGDLQLSDDTKRSLTSFARSHVRHQTHRREQIEQS
jgi:hypothetical protein